MSTAIKHLAVLLYLFPLFAQSQSLHNGLAAANKFLEANRPSKALLELKQIPKEAWDQSIHEAESRVYYHQRMYENVIQSIAEYPGTFTASEEVLLMQIKSLIHLIQLTEANILFEDMYDHIEMEQRQVINGLISYHSENYSEALKYFEAAILMDPELEEAWLYHGLTLQHIGFGEKAITSLRFSLDLNKALPEAYMGIALALSINSKQVEALEIFQEGIAACPEDLDLLTEGAKLAFDLANYELVKTYGQAAVSIYPRAPEPRSILGRSYYYEQEYEKAMDQLSDAVKLRESGSDHYYLGLAAIRSRRMKKAYQHLEIALSLGFEKDDLSQLVEHCRSILASFEDGDIHSRSMRF